MLRPLNVLEELGVTNTVVVGETVNVGVALAGPELDSAAATDVATTAATAACLPWRKPRRRREKTEREVSRARSMPLTIDPVPRRL
jgi:hypothetical protein